MTINPIGKIVLIEPIHENNTFHTEEENVSLTSKVKVVAIGDEVTTVSPGDTIIANYWGTDQIEVDGKTLYFVKESDDYILAKIN